MNIFTFTHMLALILCLSELNSAIAGVLKVQNASFDRDLKKIDLELLVTGLRKDDLFSKPEEQLKLKIGQDDRYILGPNETNTTEINEYFRWFLSDDPEIINLTEDITKPFDVLYKISIVEAFENADVQFKTVLNEDLSITLHTTLFYQNSHHYTELTQLIYGNIGVPSEFPKNFVVEGLHRGVKLRWKSDEQPLHTDGVRNSAQHVLAMLFYPEESELQLEARIAGNYKMKDKKYDGCKYVSGSPNCIKCEDTDKDIYILPEQKTLENKALNFSLSPNNGMMVYNNLSPEKEYTVVLQYSDGVKRTVCKKVKPIKSLSLTEANGEDEAIGAKEDFRCFIANAVYKDLDHPHLKLFRWFRDKILMPLPFGKTFVEFYYQFSPPIANVISNSKLLSSVIKCHLYVFAALIKIIIFVINNLVLSMTFAFSSYLIFFKFKTKKKLFLG